MKKVRENCFVSMSVAMLSTEMSFEIADFGFVMTLKDVKALHWSSWKNSFAVYHDNLTINPILLSEKFIDCFLHQNTYSVQISSNSYKRNWSYESIVMRWIRHLEVEWSNLILSWTACRRRDQSQLERNKSCAGSWINDFIFHCQIWIGLTTIQIQNLDPSNFNYLLTSKLFQHNHFSGTNSCWKAVCSIPSTSW